jgi:hypothetical protein
MEYPKYEGNYLGIVVQNNDPLKRGRVKVFVPHVSPTVYKGWIEEAADFSFKFLGDNIESDLSLISDELKKILPWANVALPIVGEVASGRYNDTTKYGTTSDSSDFDEQQANSSRAVEIGSNIDGTGEKSGAIFDQNAFMLADAFNNPAETNVNNVNKLSFNYKPETYSNRAKGAFAIPRVGAHVWVFFNGGNPLKPVVFAAAFGRDDWKGIYDVFDDSDQGQDYPGEYENFTSGDTNTETKGVYTINTETYRNKYVINQKGGTIQFVNTDNRELLKMTHFSGSFFEMNNQANITLAVNNDQKLVVGDQFLTVRGTRNEFSQNDYDNVVHGDHYRKVGDPGRVLLYEEWKSQMAEIANIKQRFDIQRCEPVEGVGVTSLLRLNSQGQLKVGNPRLCPLCTAIDDLGRDISINNKFTPEDTTGTFKMKVEAHDASNKHGDGAFGTTRAGGTAHAKFGDSQIAFGQDARLCVNSSGISSIVDSQGNTLIARPGYIASIPGYDVPCPLCNRITDPATGEQVQAYSFVIPGQSPSSFNGIWTPDPEKITLPQKYKSILPALAELEAAMGKGGSEIIEIEKNKVENIGLVTNDWGAIRVDQYGKCEPAQVQVFPGFTRIVPQPSPLIEIVNVDDLPGGTYTLNVGNKFNLLVGAGGINMKSYGVVNISGAVTTIAGEQVNIGSANEINIDGGKRLSLVGDIVSIAQRNRAQVLIDSDLGVTGKTVIRGALYVEGPIYTHEIQSVGKLQQTNKVRPHGSGYYAASPPTPMGTMITSDTAHVKKDPKGEDGVDIGASEIPIYMGYTDQEKALVTLPVGAVIGYIPAGTVLGKGNLGIDITAGSDIPVQIRPTQVGQKINGTDPELGFSLCGSGKTSLNLRGLPKEEREKIMLGYAARDASLAPGVVYGDGSDWDAIKMAPQSTTFVAPAQDLSALTNTKLRMNFRENGSIPKLAGHGPQTSVETQDRPT